MRNTKIITFAPIIAFATLKAVSLHLTGMFMMRKMHQAMQDDAIRARIHPAFIPLTGLKSHMAKFPARLPRSRLEKTEIREPSQPALSYEHIEVEVRRDLGNWADMKRPLKKFDLLLRVILHVSKGKKFATQGRTRTFRILISLPYHYTTTPTRQKFRKI